MRHGRSQFVGPTLISPPGRRNGGTTPTSTQNSQDAPLFPSMEEFKTNKSLKRPATEIPPTSFLPYKKRAIASTVSSDSNEAEPSDRRSPEYLQQLAKEPGMKEAASILLDMRTLVGTNRDEEAPTNTLKDSLFASLDGTVETASTTLEETPTNIHEEQQEPVAAAASATRTVTPAPNGMRLALPEDAHELNSLHCFVRAELLEVFALPDDMASLPIKAAVLVNLVQADALVLPSQVQVALMLLVELVFVASIVLTCLVELVQAAQCLRSIPKA